MINTTTTHPLAPRRPPSWADRYRAAAAVAPARRRAPTAVAAAAPRAVPPLPPPADSSSASPTRRSTLQMLLSASATTLLPPTASPAQASKLPAAADRAWQAVTGAPPDLAFPSFFLGTWRAQSSLVALDLPLGEELLGPSDSPLRETVERARRDELGKGPREFRVRFVRNNRGLVVFDRAFNVAALAATYGDSSEGSAAAEQQQQQDQRVDALMRRVEWNRDDPNVLLIRPGASSSSSGGIRTRVTRRSETPAPPGESDGGDDTATAPRAFETSEFMEQIFEGAGALGPGGTLAPPRVKASQVYVKWKWRTEQEAAASVAGAAASGGARRPAGGQPTLVVATQVVSDFLTPYDGDRDFLRAANRPVATYTYRLAMVRDEDTVAAAAAAT